MEQTRNTLKEFFETGDKPTQSQFADLIDSMFSLLDDGSAKARDLLQALTNLSRLKKSAVRGADFALNMRVEGDVFSPFFQVNQMSNILKGDIWIYNEGASPVPAGVDIADGDWVMALQDEINLPFDFTNTGQWKIIHFVEPYNPSNHADFIGIHDGEHTSSAYDILTNPGDTIRLESRLALSEAFSKIQWNIFSLIPTNESFAVNKRDAEVVINDEGAYNVQLRVFKIDGTEIVSKQVDGFINVQDTSLYYVEFLATDYNDDPVQDVKITFDGAQKLTGPDGRAQFANIESGTYYYSVQKNGFTSLGPIELVVSDNVSDHPVDMVLEPYIENEEITGISQVGQTVRAEYDFLPAGYEGATEIKWWVEDEEGTQIVAPVTKVKGTDPDYNEYLIPEAAAGYILKAEIKAYDVQSNTNANMLKTPFMNVDAVNVPASLGYRTVAQGDTITEDIIKGITTPDQQAILDKTLNGDYPMEVDAMWRTLFPSRVGTVDHLWMAIPVKDTAQQYAYWQNINNPFVGGGLTWDDVQTVTVTYQGVDYQYQVFIMSGEVIDARFGVNPVN